MKWLIIVLVIIVILLLAGLIWSIVQRKRTQARREQASELRGEATRIGTDRPEQEVRARKAEAEAERARAEADRLEGRAAEERRADEMTRAQQEDRIREANRLDPDVDHTADDYAPDAAHRGSVEETEPRGGLDTESGGEHRA